MSYVLTDFDIERKIEVTATSNVFWNKVKQSEGCWWAYGVEKGTVVGKLILSADSYRSEYKTVAGTYRGVNYGSTFADAYTIVATMEPAGTLTVKGYQSSSQNFTTFTRNTMMPDKAYYVGSEDLYSYCTVLHTTSTGFMSDWSPNSVREAGGTEEINLGTLGINPFTGISCNLGLKLSVSDDFVDISDLSVASTGNFKARFDYKKYNGIGFCSASRRKRIFEKTTATSAVFWYNKSNLYSGKVYCKATFTICDSKTWPTEAASFSGTVTSKTLVIK